MKRRDFDSLIDRGAYRELFVEIGWNNPDNPQPLYIAIDEQDYDFLPVADKQGFHVYSCQLDVLPTASECKKIDNKLRNYGYDYICIFVQTGTAHHLWLTPVKTNEKRELVKTEYMGGAQADFLFSKMDDLTFELTERVLISDVKAKVQGSFHLNSEKVTKDFYAQFRKEHSAFRKYIVGIDDDKSRDWYASVMLNRLMFCYFIQKKGFLDLNANYLGDKLRWVRQQQGEDKFFGTFYKGFLCALFHDGLNSPRHTADFERKYGRIPYLNGGMFDEHQLEREHEGIDIADEAFVNLFDFFDKWNWHLDTRLTASGKDINPDVLGYIFEQYINDRAAMGAYYTKEDITEYIGKNCIIPFLMDKTATKEVAKAFEPEGFVWRMLRESGDKYIYDAVKKGHSADWQQQIPDYISQGIDAVTGNLLERRSRWNEKTFENFALPTEIWRETLERLQRCDSLLLKIRGGEIHSINDFITYNLDIRQFAEDVIRQTADHRFVAHFYHALQNVTILDPTCGSGAFLFAALNILEPLYEACLDRMEEFHGGNNALFVPELEEINAKYSSNRQYFIYKSIILRNLYGVDIMVEATEIAKLRLFLKMVAVVDVDKRKDNLGLDPLPDIDFNIKCGNTLVGYATEKELDDALDYGDMFANDEFKEKISTEMQVVATAYSCFRSEQLKVYDDNASIKATKEMLKGRLATLNDLLNRHMHQSVAIGSDYDQWLRNTQPFHWLAEFYQIIHDAGGFDVIVGNPPYVEYNKKDKDTKKAISDLYRIDGYKTEECGNLYAFCMERSDRILTTNGLFGMIVPLSLTCGDRMEKLRSMLEESYTNRFYTNYEIFPSKLFDGAFQRLTIFIGNNNSDGAFVTKLHRWYSIEREVLFSKICYTKADNLYKKNGIAKLYTDTHRKVMEKIHDKSIISRLQTKNPSRKMIYYQEATNYWMKACMRMPYYKKNDVVEKPAHGRFLYFTDDMSRKAVFSLLNSSIFYVYYSAFSDGFHLTDGMVKNFPFKESLLSNSKIASLADVLENDIKANSFITTRNTQKDKIELESFKLNASKGLLDQIDSGLAETFRLTPVELDFIINYGIKYRMGDELNAEE